jgi:hypothetical protein
MWLGVLAILGACSPSPTGALPARLGDDGWNSKPTASAPLASSASSRPQTIPPDRRQPWPHLSSLPTFTTVGERRRSDHLGGQYEATLRRNSLAAGYERPGAPAELPPGAIVAQLHHRPESDEVVAVFVMEKMPRGHAPARGDWDFTVLDDRWRVEARGELRLCADCHRAATRDGLFGLPGSAPGAAPTSTSDPTRKSY